MTKVKVSEASDVVLDYMVAVAAEHNIVWDSITPWVDIGDTNKLIGPNWKSCGKPCGWSPSTHGGDGMPIIEREKISIIFDISNDVAARTTAYPPEYHYGPTILLAAMRCYVTSKPGPEVEVPDVLVRVS